jgi:tRNA threonylcarbamoyladenosine biosynthesis protein TsaE
MILSLDTNDPQQTEQVAETIGRRLKGGEVIELVGDLGAGKTTFVRGLVRGAGSEDHVSSPTYTISKVYKAKKLWLNHFDFYRLQDAGIIEHEISESITDGDAVTVIEWGGVVVHVLPEDRLTINFIRTGEEKRQVVLKFPDSLIYLTEDEDDSDPKN